MEKPSGNQSLDSRSADSATGMQKPNNQPSLVLGAGQQPSILQLGGLQSYLILAAGQPVTALHGAGLNVVSLGNNLSILQANGLRLPIIQANGLQSLTSLTSGAKPTTSQAGSLQPQIFQLGGIQSPTVQIGSSVGAIGLQPTPYQLGGLQRQSSILQPSTVQIGPTGQFIGLQPQVFQPTEYQTQSTIASEIKSHGLPPVSYELSTPNIMVKRVNKEIQETRKKAGKLKSETVTYADVACSAYSVPKVKHTSTNTAKINKSIGCQANISLRNKSQGVQCPEGGNSNLIFCQTLQESSTQAEQTVWGSQAGVQDSDPSLQRSVMFVQDMGPVGNVLPAYEAWQADKLFLQDLQRIRRHRYMLYEPGQIQFDDVAIYFSKEEWEYLKEEDKDLYMEMMVKNYRTLHSLGWITVKPPLITMIEQGEDLYVKYPKQFGKSQIPGLLRKDSTGEKIVNSIVEEEYNLQKFSERLRKSIDDFLTFCIQQTEDMMSGAAMDLSASQQGFSEGPFCQVNPLLAIDERPFKCFRCERRFKRFCDLVSHQKFHPSENGFSCFKCKVPFKNVKALTKHELTHTGEKPFICPRCGKRFSTQQLLDKHLGVTLKKNPYVCAECGKRFAKKYSLRKHEMIHNREKPFLCSICGKGFTEEEEFNEHQRIHMEEHIYSCDFCGKRFSSKPSYEKHRQEHATSQLFPDSEQQGQLLLLKQIQDGESVLPKELNRLGDTDDIEFHDTYFQENCPKNRKAQSGSCSSCQIQKMSQSSVSSEQKVKQQTPFHVEPEHFTFGKIKCYRVGTPTGDHLDSPAKEESCPLKKEENSMDTISSIEQTSAIVKKEPDLNDGEQMPDPSFLIAHKTFQVQEEEASDEDNDAFTVQDDQLSESIPAIPISNDNIIEPHQIATNTGIDLICSLCREEFLCHRDLLTHMEIHGQESVTLSKSLRTPTGESGFADQPKSIRLFICSYCGKSYSRMTHFKVHLRIHTGERPFSCSECGKCFIRKSELVSHHRIHTGEKPFACSVCGKRFANRSNVNSHERIHKGEKPFACSDCGKCFTDSSGLHTHKRVHTREKPFLCSDCGKRFSTRSHLITHQRFHSGEAPFSCSECGKSFACNANLMTHQRIHTGEKPYFCKECGKCFSDRSCLFVHRRIHTGVQPYTCAHCGKFFPSRSHLVRHEIIHTGEKPFSCSECGKCFNSKTILVAHQRIHTGEKPFSCKECGKCFRGRSAVIAHQRIHTGEKPFSCSECGKCFTDHSGLITHRKLHAGNKDYKCIECGKCFVLKHYLTRHLAKHEVRAPVSS
ncbi:zinc finger protein 836-like [Hyla sarda]|uniref:zinc finger protein 836-like n=1 Tax=Hyla sarda TaxID=327740 RepID=UPI0024C43BB3|nr:zinc finger protein 836-like [Hyla sarda]